jgi:translation elongation factor EF-4
MIGMRFDNTSQAVGSIRKQLTTCSAVSGSIEIKSDASAAVGIANRIGVGKVRHIEVNQLRLQDKVHKKEIKINLN